MKKFLNILGYISLGFLVFFLFFMFYCFFNINRRIIGAIGLFVIILIFIFYYKKKKIVYEGIFLLIAVLTITIFCLLLNYSYGIIKKSIFLFISG